jgi:hypothetical protein
LEIEKGNLASYREKWRRKVWCAMRQKCRYYSIPFFEVLKAWVVNKQMMASLCQGQSATIHKTLEMQVIF